MESSPSNHAKMNHAKKMVSKITAHDCTYNLTKFHAQMICDSFKRFIWKCTLPHVLILITTSKLKKLIQWFKIYELEYLEIGTWLFHEIKNYKIVSSRLYFQKLSFFSGSDGCCISNQCKRKWTQTRRYCQKTSNLTKPNI